MRLLSSKEMNSKSAYVMADEENINQEAYKSEEVTGQQHSSEGQEASNQGQQEASNTDGPINDEQLKEMAIQVLKSVYDPEIPVDIYELGLIYEVTVYPVNNLYVKMTLTSPSCPVAGTLPSEVETKLAGIKGVNNVDLELTFEPPWDMSKMSEEARLELGLM
jgi:FeS assembly SUF system protein